MLDLSSRIAHYRDEVRHGADLEAAVGVFTALTLDPGFSTLGRPHDDARLREIVRQSLSRALGVELSFVDLCLTRIESARFVHGAGAAICSGELIVVAITYFEEDDMGLCAAFRGDDAATLLRFTAHTLPASAFNAPWGVA
jgi:hypothetical protein